MLQLVVDEVKCARLDLIPHAFISSVLASERGRTARSAFASIAVRIELNVSHVEEASGGKGFFETTRDSSLTRGSHGLVVEADLDFVASRTRRGAGRWTIALAARLFATRVHVSCITRAPAIRCPGGAVSF